MKLKVSHTIDSNLLKKLEEFKRENYPYLSRSDVIELLLRDALRGREISVVK